MEEPNSCNISPRDVYFDSNIIKDSLCDDIWDGAQMKDDVREKLLDIGKKFHTYLKVDSPIEDIILTGSLSNYNWNSSSDLDVHIILDDSLIGTPELAQNLLITKKILWNRLRKNVRVKGRTVELYAQSKFEDHRATGQFSILNNCWIHIPEKITVEIDEHKIKTLIALFQCNIENLSSIQDNEERYLEAVRIKDNILKLRRASIEFHEGEYSLGNLVFKSLRNMPDNGLTKLFDIISSSYDDKLSLAELQKLSGQLLTEDITSSDEQKIRKLIQQELVQVFKKEPLVSEKDVREIVRQMLRKLHKWNYEKSSIWMSAL